MNNFEENKCEYIVNACGDILNEAEAKGLDKVVLPEAWPEERVVKYDGVLGVDFSVHYGLQGTDNLFDKAVADGRSEDEVYGALLEALSRVSNILTIILPDTNVMVGEFTDAIGHELHVFVPCDGSDTSVVEKVRARLAVFDIDKKTEFHFQRVLQPGKDNGIVPGKEDVCPVCGSTNLTFGEWEHLDNGAVISFECEDCGSSGTEGYDLVFDGNFYDLDIPEPVRVMPEEKKTPAEQAGPKKYTATITLAPWQNEAIQHYREACEASRRAALEKSDGWDLKAEQSFWEKFWRDDDGVCSDERTFLFTAHFDDGHEMDVKLCGCQDSAPWTEAVLFNDRGGECCCTEPGDVDDMVGEWELEYDGVTYVAKVEVYSGDQPDKTFSIPTILVKREDQ